MARPTTFALLFGAIASLRTAHGVDVSSCAELAAVDRKTETLVTFTQADFACDEYTRLSIKSPAMVFSSSVGAVTFSNLAFNVFGALTVEPDVEFTGIVDAEKRGGALKVSKSGNVVFEGITKFTDVSVKTTDLGNDEEKVAKGGAIHNMGGIVFMKASTFTRCFNNKLEWGSGPGGAVSNYGSMSFKEDLIMDDNTADDYYGGAEGGALFNRGDVTVDGDATFLDNYGGRGGAIFQMYEGTFTVNGFAHFLRNKCIDTYGGTVCSIGGEMTFKGGALFEDGFAENSGDGGNGGAFYLYDGANVVLEGAVTFKNNYGFWGGAITIENEEANGYYTENDETFEQSSITFPDDTVFVDNQSDHCPDIAYTYDPDTCGP